MNHKGYVDHARSRGEVKDHPVYLAMKKAVSEPEESLEKPVDNEGDREIPSAEGGNDH